LLHVLQEEVEFVAADDFEESDGSDIEVSCHEFEIF